MLTIRKKIVLSYTMVFGFLLIIISIFAIDDIRREQKRMVSTQLADYSQKLRSELTRQIYSKEFPKLEKFNKINSEGLIHRQFMILNSDFKKVVVVGEFSKDFSTEMLKLNVEKWFEVKQDNHDFYCTVIKEELDTSRKYFIVAASSLQEYKRQITIHIFFFIIVIPITLFITAAAANFISKYSFKPILNMIDTVETITATSLSKRIELPKVKDEIRKLGETLNDMINRLDKSFESQKRFIADASHEIKTPLTVIQTELELAELSSKEEEIKESIKIALTEIERLNVLSNSLLALAKLDASPQALNYELVRLDELVIECIQLMKSVASVNRVELYPSISDIIELQADREKLKSVIINLIDNAIKFSKVNSKVEINLEKNNSSAILKIKDYGCGIPEAELQHIFKRFYRSNETRGKIPGSGLGLSLAQEIVRIHKGTISVESEVGKRTTFIVQLPLS
ncbi:MAG: HAMP domain-containing sensor histidine kinase [Ignavibacteriales bacterium]|nr:HAMP domain-containing sensor histidine kinase [Ignavibacteriales bacterium]